MHNRYLNFEDDSDYEPGAAESLSSMTKIEASAFRDRHLRLRYELLEKALPEILSTYVSHKLAKFR